MGRLCPETKVWGERQPVSTVQTRYMTMQPLGRPWAWTDTVINFSPRQAYCRPLKAVAMPLGSLLPAQHCCGCHRRGWWGRAPAHLLHVICMSPGSRGVLWRMAHLPTPRVCWWTIIHHFDPFWTCCCSQMLMTEWEGAGGLVMWGDVLSHGAKHMLLVIYVIHQKKQFYIPPLLFVWFLFSPETTYGVNCFHQFQHPATNSEIPSQLTMR